MGSLSLLLAFYQGIQAKNDHYTVVFQHVIQVEDPSRIYDGRRSSRRRSGFLAGHWRWRGLGAFVRQSDAGQGG